MRFKDIAYVENTFVEQNPIDNADVKALVTIDIYPVDENAEGEVAAKVYITKHDDIVVSFTNNTYRLHQGILDKIEESKQILKDITAKPVHQPTEQNFSQRVKTPASIVDLYKDGYIY